mmetsp:Transcript_29956/g.85774  ORF Transcript_29956/g.85774 Transcript_29956/m.85774 type:complete len:265 (+) Transcript_29956:20-814(+)
MARFCYGMDRDLAGEFDCTAESMVCGQKDHVDWDWEEQQEAPLLGNRVVVQFLGSPGTVDTEVVIPPFDMEKGPGGRRQFETIAVLPCEMEVEIPLSYVPGQRVKVKSPHGIISIRPPSGSDTEFGPGSRQRLRLAPAPEYRIEVPPGMACGTELNFTREDGSNVAVTIPQDAVPGSVVDVLPTVLMVRAPTGSRPGDFVIFPVELGGAGPTSEPSWCRAQVPPDVLPEDHFPARMPVSGHAEGLGGILGPEKDLFGMASWRRP